LSKKVRGRSIAGYQIVINTEQKLTQEIKMRRMRATVLDLHSVWPRSMHSFMTSIDVGF
jgi:hypothetical protein